MVCKGALRYFFPSLYRLAMSKEAWVVELWKDLREVDISMLH